MRIEFETKFHIAKVYCFQIVRNINKRNNKNNICSKWYNSILNLKIIQL